MTDVAVLEGQHILQVYPGQISEIATTNAVHEVDHPER